MKITFEKHWIHVTRIKRHNNHGIPERGYTFWYRDMRSWDMWKLFLRWCFLPESKI
jgi:hypothetical protein